MAQYVAQEGYCKPRWHTAVNVCGAFIAARKPQTIMRLWGRGEGGDHAFIAGILTASVEGETLISIW